MELHVSCPLGTTRLVPQEKFPRKPYNKSFKGPFIFYEIGGAGGIEGGGHEKKTGLKGGAIQKNIVCKGGSLKKLP